MTRDETRRRLERTGQSAAPPVDAAFADALEQRLRAVHATLPHAPVGDGATATPQPGTTPVRAWWRSPVPVAAALALLLVVSFGAVLRRPAGVELASAYDAVVVLPDGRTMDAAAGLRLEDGAVIRTGAQGHALVDGLRMGPGETAVVDDGEVRPVRETTARPPAEPAEPPASSEPPTAPRPTSRPSSAPLLPALPGQTVRPAPQRTTAPADEPSTRPTASPSAATDEEILVGSAPADEAHALTLTAVVGRSAVDVSWSVLEHPDFAGYLLLRSPHPEAPTWPLGHSRTEIVAKSQDPRQTSHVDADPRYRPVYRVIALDRDGREIARSRPVTPRPPDDRDNVAERAASK